MRRSMMVLPVVTLLALAGLGLSGCETLSDTKTYTYPAEYSERVRPNSSIPQLGTGER